MKLKFTAIFLFIALCTPGFITPVILQYQKVAAKKKAKQKIIEGLQDSELVVLRFSKEEEKDLKWEHSKEFEYKNHKYDIVKSISTDTHTTYWCWPDNEETEINKQLKKHIDDLLDLNPDNKKTRTNLLAYYGFFFLEPSSSFEFKSTEIKLHRAYFYKNSNYHFFKTPSTPPPKRS